MKAKTSSNRLIFLSLASALVILIVCGGLAWFFGSPQLKEINARHYIAISQLQADRQAAVLKAYLDQLTKEINAFASHPEVIEAVQNKDSHVLENLENRALSVIPGLVSAQLVAMDSLGTAGSGLDTQKLRNNIELDMTSRAFAGETVPIEAYKFRSTWYLTAASQIKSSNSTSGSLNSTDDNSEAVGVLLASAGNRIIHDLLSEMDTNTGESSASLTINQGPPQLIAKAGTTTAKTAFTTYSNILENNWVVQFSPTELWLTSHSFSASNFWLAVGLAALLILIWVIVLQKLLNKSLKEDASGIAMYISQLARQPDAIPANLSFSELQPIQEALQELSFNQVAVQSPATEEDKLGESKAEEPKLNKPNDLDLARAVNQGADEIEVELILDEAEEEGDSKDTDGKSSALEVPAEIFRAYDIRGLAATLNNKLVYDLGLAIGTEALQRGQKRMVVGADARNSSPEIASALIRGLIATGVEVIDVGVVPTPILYFATQHLKTQSGVMVTGSHNPSEYNGLKIFLDNHALCGDQIQAIKNRMECRDFQEGKGSQSQADVSDAYRQRVADDIAVGGRPKVVIDCGNGVAGTIAPRLFEELGCQVIPLYCELDGSFPNHHPDPSIPANMQDLVAMVTAESADLGIAFDGDADRIGVVTAEGEIIPADRLLMLYASDILNSNPGADIIFDVKCSRHLGDLIRKQGGRPIMCQSGHSWIKEKMKETGALLGGEYTGHICFKDRWYGFDDALYAAARLIEILTIGRQSLTEALVDYPSSVNTPELFISSDDEEKFALVEKLGDNSDFGDANITRIDGLRVDFEDGWGLVRASNTIPALTLRFEADSEDALQRIKTIFREQLMRNAPTLELPF